MINSFEVFEKEFNAKESKNSSETLIEFNKALNESSYNQDYLNVYKYFKDFNQKMKKDIENGNLKEILEYSQKHFNTGRTKDQMEKDIKKITKKRKEIGEDVMKKLKERREKKEKEREKKEKSKKEIKELQEKIQKNDESSSEEGF